jgi:hypothetical protein
MGRYDSRLAKMIDLSTSLAAFRHTALLMAESIMVGRDPTRQKQDRLDRLHSTIEKLETALEVERGLESANVIASDIQRLEEAPLAPPVLWA